MIRLLKTELLRFSQAPYNLQVFPLGQSFDKVGKCCIICGMEFSNRALTNSFGLVEGHGGQGPINLILSFLGNIVLAFGVWGRWELMIICCVARGLCGLI